MKNKKYLIFMFLFFFCMYPEIGLATDTDNDGLSDWWEDFYYTSSTLADTDGDGYSDGEEVLTGYSPHAANGVKMHEHDFDDDGINDWIERWFMTDIGNADSDGDGFTDAEEILSGYSPINIGGGIQFDRELFVDRTHQQMYFNVDGVKVLRFPVSTGNPYTETPAGTFEIERKVAVKNYVGADYFIPDVWWNMQFKPLYYIHGARWHNDFGKRTHSHGCINMRPEDAKFIYPFVHIGIPLTVTGTTPINYVVTNS